MSGRGATRMDRFNRVQSNTWQKRSVVRTATSAEVAPTTGLDFLDPPAGQVIEVAVRLKAGVTGATLVIYRDATVVNGAGDEVAPCYPAASSTSLTGGAGITDHLVVYTHNGGRVCLRLQSITDGNAPDLVEPATVAYRWC